MAKIDFVPQNFGLKRSNLYETITTTYSINEISGSITPNASCMGIRLVENNKIKINPYPSTTTYKNLKENSYITINFVTDVYLYALAALKDPVSPIGLTEFPSKYFDFQYLDSLTMDVPYIKKAWGILIGKISKEFQQTRHDSFGDIVIPVFILDVIFAKLFRKSFKLINRAENLAIESIILTTRLKIASSLNNNKLFNHIYEQIVSNIENLERFTKNKRALKAIEIVSNYVDKLLNQV